MLHIAAVIIVSQIQKYHDVLVNLREDAFQHLILGVMFFLFLVRGYRPKVLHFLDQKQDEPVHSIIILEFLDINRKNSVDQQP